ncbi:hypothetical protein AAFH68_37040 [Flavobacterium sp. CGRL1]
MLILNLNEEYKIKIEKGNDFCNSIFKEVYISASLNVAEIISKSKRGSKYDDFNNIIAFTGERGKGKSSSMISFRDALVNNQKSCHINFFETEDLDNVSLGKAFEILRNNKFAEIDIIDPSLFRGNESLFEIILAKMFSKFQDSINKKDSKIRDEVRRSLIKHFQSVFENLQMINSDRKELYKQETIEVLSKLATSSNLRECFKDLVDYYLENFENKQYLVISVDDFDLNISGTFEMLEDIRQFLIQSKIVILIACKIEQLRESVLNNLYKEFEYLIKYQSSEIDENKLINKTEKYLEKLIPFEKRLELPNLKMF